MIDALVEALGPVDMARFLQSFDLGSGDYTRERVRWLDQSLDEISALLLIQFMAIWSIGK